MATLPKIAAGDSVSIFGQKGSGKTELAKRLLLQQRNAIIVDTKLNEDWSDIGIAVKGDDIYRVGPGRFVWHTPESFIAGPDADGLREIFFRWAYRRGRRVLYVDEVLDVAESAGSYPNALKVIATRGRSAGIGLWTTTQRPHGVPLFVFSEASHLFIFQLSLDSDRKRVEAICNSAINWNAIAGNHKFYYMAGGKKIQGPYILPWP